MPSVLLLIPVTILGVALLYTIVKSVEACSSYESRGDTDSVPRFNKPVETSYKKKGDGRNKQKKEKQRDKNEKEKREDRSDGDGAIDEERYISAVDSDEDDDFQTANTTSYSSAGHSVGIKTSNTGSVRKRTSSQVISQPPPAHKPYKSHNSTHQPTPSTLTRPPTLLGSAAVTPQVTSSNNSRHSSHTRHGSYQQSDVSSCVTEGLEVVNGSSSSSSEEMSPAEASNGTDSDWRNVERGVGDGAANEEDYAPLFQTANTRSYSRPGYSVGNKNPNAGSLVRQTSNQDNSQPPKPDQSHNPTPQHILQAVNDSSENLSTMEAGNGTDSDRRNVEPTKSTTCLRRLHHATHNAPNVNACSNCKKPVPAVSLVTLKPCGNNSMCTRCADDLCNKESAKCLICKVPIKSFFRQVTS